jgi:putative transposase
VNRRVVHRDAAIQQQQLKIAIADGKHRIPPHRPASSSIRHRSYRAKVSPKTLRQSPENLHRPTRRHERQRQRFESPEQAQDFLSAHAFINGRFHPRRHLLTSNSYRAVPTEAFKIWHQETGVQIVAWSTRHFRT